MRFIPKCYYNSEIIKLVNYYISEGYTSFRSLDENDQDKLTEKCIQVLGNDADRCITDIDEFSQTLHHFKNYLLTGKKEYAFDLAETMRRNANQHFSEVMDQLFADMTSENENEANKLAGLKPIKDNVTGEQRWVR